MKKFKMFLEETGSVKDFEKFVRKNNFDEAVVACLVSGEFLYRASSFKGASGNYSISPAKPDPRVSQYGSDLKLLQPMWEHLNLSSRAKSIFASPDREHALIFNNNLKIVFPQNNQELFCLDNDFNYSFTDVIDYHLFIDTSIGDMFDELITNCVNTYNEVTDNDYTNRDILKKFNLNTSSTDIEYSSMQKLFEFFDKAIFKNEKMNLHMMHADAELKQWYEDVQKKVTKFGSLENVVIAVLKECDDEITKLTTLFDFEFDTGEIWWEGNTLVVDEDFWLENIEEITKAFSINEDDDE